MNQKRLVGIFMLFLCTIGFVSCGDDDGPKPDPLGTVTLSMVNEANGKTMLGESGVYLDKVNNFLGGNNAFITDLGGLSGIGNVEDIKVSTLARQMAATAGHGYWVYAQDTYLEFPSGISALRVGDLYYKMYVESMLEENKGVKVKYLPVTIPNDLGLPAADTNIGSFSESYRLKVDITKFEDLEYFISRSDYTDKFRFYVEEDTSEGHAKKYLYVEQEYFFGYNLIFSLYMRVGEVFTFVNFIAK